MTTFQQFADEYFKPVKDIDYDPAQLKRGIEVEHEHTKDDRVATIIAKAHLAEDPEYYIKLGELKL